jgi:hypothetical protein
VSKQDHRVVAEHNLRLGETLHARAGAVNAGGTRGSSGGGGATWGKQGRASAGSGKWRQGRGGHVAWLIAALGRWVHGTWPAGVAAMRRAEKQRRRRGGRRRGTEL